MSDGREPKRVRQACVNCRRKKARCPGERPACGLCARLGQDCQYAPTTNAAHVARSSPGSLSRGRVSFSDLHQGLSDEDPPPNQHDLAARVARLEAQLAAQQSHSQQSLSPRRASRHRQSQHHNYSKFSRPPPPPALEAVVDGYFTDCHNQPYCFFNESHFRSRLAAGEIPQYLVLAFAASAARFSSHEYFKDRQLEAVAAYARAAWIVVIDQVFATDQSLDVAAAQATSLLAIIDFTAGHHRLGWVKVGLAVRLVQGLKLNAEPDLTLPNWQQEEHRRVFWSVYILDKFVCSRSRLPAMLDIDCTVALPCCEEDFRAETPTSMSTLGKVQESHSRAASKSLDSFAILVIMCSVLGLTARETFPGNDSPKLPPWDCNSSFAKISGILLDFESMHVAGSEQLGALITTEFGTYDEFDRQRVGPFIWARGVYHLCGCLLYHPVNLARHRKAYGSDFPPTFAREILDRGHRHAMEITNILQTLLSTACCARGSYLGYLAVCAASIHKLYVHSLQADVAADAMLSFELCQGFLEHDQPPIWPNYQSMAAALKKHEMDPALARQLINPSMPIDINGNESGLESLLIDYGWVSDARRTENSNTSTPSFSAGVGEFIFSDDMFTVDGRNFLVDSGRFDSLPDFFE